MKTGGIPTGAWRLDALIDSGAGSSLLAVPEEKFICRFERE
jgi:hypothetical protein